MGVNISPNSKDKHNDCIKNFLDIYILQEVAKLKFNNFMN